MPEEQHESNRSRGSNLPWVEKYRPDGLQELISHDDIINTIRSGHQPSAISHQPSAICHLPSAISHQPSAISHDDIINTIRSGQSWSRSQGQFQPIMTY